MIEHPFERIRTLMWVQDEDRPALYALLDQLEAQTFEIDGRYTITATGFINEIKKCFPLDPGIENGLRGTSIHWDAVIDSIWGGLPKVPYCLIIWNNVHYMFDQALPELFKALDYFQFMSHEVFKLSSKAGEPQRILVCLLGVGDNFRPLTSWFV